MSPDPASNSVQQSTFRDDLLATELAPFWEVVDRNRTPQPATVPHCWRWADYEPLLRRAGELVSTEQAERRVLMLVNPASRGEKRAVGNLYAGVQLILPGEKARAHRHTAAALRFILDGAGALTVVDGSAVELGRFDLVLTPTWMWHDHVNETPSPMVWLDALDSPFVRAMDAWFFEPHPEEFQTVGDGRADYAPVPSSLSFPWAPMRSELWAAVSSSPGGSATVSYTDPASGGDVLPTIRCRTLGVADGGQYGTRRVGAAVYCVVEGGGVATVGGQSFDVSFGDVFCVPSWQPLSIVNRSGQDLSLFAYDDEPVLRAFGLARSSDVLEG